MTSHVVLLNLDAPLLEPAQSAAVATSLKVHVLPGGPGWTHAVDFPVALLVVGAGDHAAEWVTQLKRVPEHRATPAVCVMDQPVATWVAALKAAGVGRIMMRDEFLMDVGLLFRAI